MMQHDKLKISGELLRIALGSLGLLSSLLTDGIACLILSLFSMLIVGYPVFLDALRGLARRDMLDEKFLMLVASIGAFLIREYVEGVAVLLFFSIGEYFEHRAVARSRNSIRALMDIRPDSATVLRDGEEVTLDADEVAVGDTVVLLAGERVPVDCRILSGESAVDTSAVSGESRPILAKAGVTVLSGSVVLGGRLLAEATSVSDDSAAARILNLVESANERKSKQEAFITRFSKVYTPAVVLFALLFGGALPLILGLCSVDSFGALYLKYGYRALTFLVISCPCALVISVPLSFFGGIGGAASVGILFKGGHRMQAIAHPDVVCMDKTGTLTEGSFRLLSILPEVGYSEEHLLSLAASAELGSNHPLALAMLSAARERGLTICRPSELRELAGHGIAAEIEGVSVLVGNASLLAEFGVALPSGEYSGVLVAENGRFIGSILLGDKIRAEAKASIAELRLLGVDQIVMLTGDSSVNAEPVAAELGLDALHAGLLPDDKYRILEEFEEAGHSVLFVGDGINDAPVLARADIGVAMGGIGSDAAIEASDAVILSDDLHRLADAVRISRKTISIARFNIAFALLIKLGILALAAIGIAANMWLAVFADVGVAVIAILNAMRAMRPPKRRDKENHHGKNN